MMRSSRRVVTATTATTATTTKVAGRPTPPRAPRLLLLLPLVLVLPLVALSSAAGSAAAAAAGAADSATSVDLEAAQLLGLRPNTREGGRGGQQPQGEGGGTVADDLLLALWRRAWHLAVERQEPAAQLAVAFHVAFFALCLRTAIAVAYAAPLPGADDDSGGADDGDDDDDDDDDARTKRRRRRDAAAAAAAAAASGRPVTASAAVFAVGLAGVVASQPLNAWLRERQAAAAGPVVDPDSAWFYWDPNGTAIAVTWALPLLLSCTVVVVGWTVHIARLVGSIKLAQIQASQRDMRNRKKQQQQQGDASGAAAAAGKPTTAAAGRKAGAGKT